MKVTWEDSLREAWRKSAEDFLWTAEILMTMGRYAQAVLLACHAYDLCVRAEKGDFELKPFKEKHN